MFNYITIDGGTTNTRISLVVKNDVVDTVKSHIGARNGIDGKEEYKQTLKNSMLSIPEPRNIQISRSFIRRAFLSVISR